jgi:hypothetical protein
LEADENFAIEEYLNIDFFRTVFLSLISNYKPDKGKLTPKSTAYSELANKYRNTYIEHCSCQPPALKYANQIATYEGTKVLTAYKNNISTNFGNIFRMLLNILLKRDERIRTVKQKGGSEQDINDAIKTIISTCTSIKLNIASGDVDNFQKKNLNEVDVNVLKNIFQTYPENYQFEKESIYFDCKARPENHFKAFFKLVRTCEKPQRKFCSPFPLKTKWVPQYITIGSYILNTQILKNSVISHLDKNVVWSAVLDLKSKDMKDQGDIKFRGLLLTDDVGVSIL